MKLAITSIEKNIFNCAKIKIEASGANKSFGKDRLLEIANDAVRDTVNFLGYCENAFNQYNIIHDINDVLGIFNGEFTFKAYGGGTYDTFKSPNINDVKHIAYSRHMPFFEKDGKTVIKGSEKEISEMLKFLVAANLADYSCEMPNP